MRKRFKVELKCPVCNNYYLKDTSEFKRNVKLKRKSYCSLNCKAKDLFEYSLPKEIRSNYDISKHSKNLADEYTDFRYAFKLIKARMHKGCKISLHDLKEIWERQKGICPYVGIKLKLMKHGYKFQDVSENRFEIASLDRIDSSKGYEKGNLCFVSMMVNFMKNNMSVEKTINFMRIITNHFNKNSNENILKEISNYVL